MNANTQSLALKDFFIAMINERGAKYEQRFESVERSLADQRAEIKLAIESAIVNTKDSMAANAASLATMLGGIERRFESVNEFRASLADQTETFARKSDLESMVSALKESTLKSEGQVDRKFEAANEWRNQLNAQAGEFARKSEMEIRFEALEKKLDTAISQLQLSKGRESGIGLVWSVVAIAAALILSALELGLLSHR